MKIRSLPRFVLLIASVLSCSGLVAQEPEVGLKVTTDRPDAVYKVGDKVAFQVESTVGNKPNAGIKISYVLSQDGYASQPAQEIELTDGKGTVTGTLEKPGFLLLRASVGKTMAFAGAAFDPTTIHPSMPVPDDFDQFWNAQKAELAKVPLKSTLTPVESPAKDVEAFDVQVDCLGKPVSGYFGRPKNAAEKSLPAILFVHGAGVRSSNLGSVYWAKRGGGMLAFDINAHGIPNGKPAEFYTSLTEGELKDYRSIGRNDRETCYFKGMFLRLVRAIDFLAAQPEWDGKTVIVYGSSQGGFQAFAAAGLDARVSYFCAGVPAGCDHTGSAANRISGWPKIVPNGKDGKPDPTVLQASRYFDCVNFATRAKCKGAAVTVGFIDGTCPPTSVYAAYNALIIPKAMHADPLVGHTNSPAASKFMQDSAERHVQDAKTAAK